MSADHEETVSYQGVDVTLSWYGDTLAVSVDDATVGQTLYAETQVAFEEGA